MPHLKMSMDDFRFHFGTANDAPKHRHYETSGSIFQKTMMLIKKADILLVRSDLN